MSWEGAAALIGLAHEGYQEYYYGSGRNKDRREQARARTRMEREQRQANERNSLTGRLKEARAAGVHPLVGLGYGGQVSPVEYQSGPSQERGGGVVEGIQRAAGAMQTHQERELDKAVVSLQLEGMQLDNEYKASQIRLLNNQPPIPEWNDAGSPMPGQGDSRTKMRPSEIIASQSGDTAGQAGAITDYGYAKTSDGGLTIVPSQDVKERIEDQMIPELSWSMRNTYMKDPPRPGKEYNHLLRKGEDWEWIPHLQEWRPADAYGNIRGMSSRDWGHKFQRWHTKPRRK